MVFIKKSFNDIRNNYQYIPENPLEQEKIGLYWQQPAVAIGVARVRFKETIAGKRPSLRAIQFIYCHGG